MNWAPDSITGACTLCQPTTTCPALHIHVPSSPTNNPELCGTCTLCTLDCGDYGTLAVVNDQCVCQCDVDWTTDSNGSCTICQPANPCPQHQIHASPTPDPAACGTCIECSTVLTCGPNAFATAVNDECVCQCDVNWVEDPMTNLCTICQPTNPCLSTQIPATPTQSDPSLCGTCLDCDEIITCGDYGIAIGLQDGTCGCQCDPNWSQDPQSGECTICTPINPCQTNYIHQSPDLDPALCATCIACSTVLPSCNQGTAIAIDDECSCDCNVNWTTDGDGSCTICDPQTQCQPNQTHATASVSDPTPCGTCIPCEDVLECGNGTAVSTDGIEDCHCQCDLNWVVDPTTNSCTICQPINSCQINQIPATPTQSDPSLCGTCLDCDDIITCGVHGTAIGLPNGTCSCQCDPNWVIDPNTNSCTQCQPQTPCPSLHIPDPDVCGTCISCQDTVSCNGHGTVVVVVDDNVESCGCQCDPIWTTPTTTPPLPTTSFCTACRLGSESESTFTTLGCDPQTQFVTDQCTCGNCDELVDEIPCQNGTISQQGLFTTCTCVPNPPALVTTTVNHVDINNVRGRYIIIGVGGEEGGNDGL